MVQVLGSKNTSQRSSSRIVVPAPLQPAFVHTSHGLLPHGRRDKGLDRGSRVLRVRRDLLRGGGGDRGHRGVDVLDVLDGRNLGGTWMGKT